MNSQDYNFPRVGVLRRLALSIALWDAVDVALVVTDQQGTIVDVNDGFCSLSGYPRGELIGHLLATLVSSEDITRDMTRAGADNIATTLPSEVTFPQKPPHNQPTGDQWTLLAKTGACLDVVLAMTQVHVEGDVYQVITVKDVTALLQSQTRQAELYQQLALALQLGDIQVWRWDIVRDEVTRKAAAGSRVIRQDDVLEHVHEDDRPALRQAIQRALAQHALAASGSAGSSETFCEYRLHSPQGWQWFATTMAVSQRDAEGRPLVMLGVNRNIQDDKNREQDVGALQHKLERIIGALQAGVIEVNAHGEIVYVNPAASDMLATPAAQLLTRHYQTVPWQFYDERGTPLAAGGMPLFGYSLETGDAIRDIKLRTERPHKWFNVRAQPLFEASDTQPKRVSGVVVSLNDITAIESSRRELVSVSARLADILESTTDAFFSLDRQWHFTYLNRQAERTLQRGREQLLGRHVWDHFTDADVFRRHYEQVFAEQVSVTFEAYYAPLDVHFEVHAYPFGDELGVFFRDVSNRREARKRLLESEERFRRSFEASPLGMVIVTPERQYIRANQNFCHMIGYSEDEIVGRYTYDVTYTEDRKKTEALVAQLFAGEIASYTIDKRYYHKDGHDVWARLSVSLVRDEQGAPLYMIGQIQDLTEQLEREAAYQTIVDHALQGFVLLQDGRVVLVNLAAVALLGYTEQEIYAWQAAQQLAVIYSEDVSRFTTAVRRITTGQINAFQGILRFVHRHGDVRWAEVYMTSVPYQGSAAVQLAFVDVTVRQQAQEEVKRALVERTVLLQEVHHRVRNNLQVIASMLNLQAKRLESIAAKHALEDSHRRILAMASVHRALHESADLANIDFAAYLRGFVQSLLAPKRDEVILHTQLEPVYLTAEQAIPCALIVNELVSNALEHAFVNGVNGGNAAVEVSSDAVSDAGADAEINKVEVHLMVHLQQNSPEISADETTDADISPDETPDETPDKTIITLRVADNGIGLLANALQNDTLGMTIVQSLANQLDATLTLSATDPQAVRPGTTVTMTFEVVSLPT